MKKLIILNLLLVSFFHLSAQDSCVIKVCPNDCLNCYAGMQNVETTGNNIKKTIVFPDMSSAEVKEYLNHVLNISDTSLYNIIVSDSIYNSMSSSLSSEVYVYDENKLEKHSLLKKFDGFEKKNGFEIKIPDTIAISTSGSIINAREFFLISDYTFGKFVFVDKNKDNNVSVLTGEELTTRENYIKITGDTSAYNLFLKYKNQLRRGNADRIRIDPARGSRNQPVSFLMAPDIKFINGTMGIGFKTGIIDFNTPEDYKIFQIDEKSHPSEYYVNPGAYTEYKGKYYLQMGKVDKNANDQNMIGEFVLSDGKYIFSKFLNYKLPTEYQPAIRYSNLGKVLTFVNPYAFLQYSLSYYDLDSDKTLKLPFDTVKLDFFFNSVNYSLTKLESNYVFVDAYVTGKTIRLLFMENNKYYLAEIDRKDGHLISKKEILKPDKKIKLGFYFYSGDKIFYLSTDNSICVEKIKYRQ